jgi:ABC-type lipoprotein release transport system permease subunit
MIGAVSFHYAFRSLFRQPKRTLLSVMGVGFGTGIGFIATAVVSGSSEMQIRAASESGAGHIRVVPEPWPETRKNSLRLNQPQQVLAALESTSQVRAIAQRARATGLLAFGNRTAGVEVVGVVPEAELNSNRIVRKSKLEGRYLNDDDQNAVVIGKALSKKLDVELEDDLMVTISGKGEMRSAMLRIVGLVATGSTEMDSGICHVLLDDVSEITGYQGPGEVTALLQHSYQIDAVQQELNTRMLDGNTVITWETIHPGLAAGQKSDKAFSKMLAIIIMIVVALGVASAQLTAYLERRREFGILTGLGMRARQVVALILMEAILIGLAGAILALAVGGPISYYLATTGINVAELWGMELAIDNVLLEPIIYGEFRFWIVWYAFGVSIFAVLLASIYPMWKTVQTHPAEAMRGD